VPRHDLDVVSLVAGVLFGGTAVAFLVDRATGISGRWVWPVLLILVGIVGLLVVRAGNRPDPGD
jgi:cytochrome c oxidase subunit IV